MSKQSEARELLALQADLIRLKINAERLKMQKERERERSNDTFFSNSVSTVVGLADSLPSRHLLMKTFLLPLGWKYRIVAGAAVAAWQISRLWSRR